MLEQYLPIVFVVLFALAFALGSVVFSHFIGRKKSNNVKEEPFECGIPPVGDARISFSVKFYPLALLFLLFDIEIIFILVWAYILKTPGYEIFLFLEMFVFLIILMAGYVYCWQSGVLNWREKQDE